MPGKDSNGVTKPSTPPRHQTVMDAGHLRLGRPRFRADLQIHCLVRAEMHREILKY